MTPLLTHAFIIINEWHSRSLAGSTLQVPWHNIRDQTKFGMAPLQSTSRNAATDSPHATPTVPALPPAPAQPTPAPIQDTPADKGKHSNEMKQGGREKKQQKHKEGGLPAKKVPKRRKPSAEEVPAHHLVSEDDSSVVHVTQDNTGKPTIRRADALWPNMADRVTPRCTNCDTKAIPCVTTGHQLACAACHVAKVKCSYSSARKSRLAAQEADTTSKVAGKRKRVNDGDDEYEASTSTKSRAPSKTRAPSIEIIPHPITPTTCVSESPGPTLPAASKFTPSLGGLQISVSDLRVSMKSMEEKMRNLAAENKMIRGWMETMMVVKEKMLVTQGGYLHDLSQTIHNLCRRHSK